MAIRVDMTMSLDGYVAGPDDGENVPLGVGGFRLFNWLDRRNDPGPSGQVYAEAMATRAVISGRRTYEMPPSTWLSAWWRRPTPAGSTSATSGAGPAACWDRRRVATSPASRAADACAGQSISTPGLSSPRGSTDCLAARNAAANRSGRWRS